MRPTIPRSLRCATRLCEQAPSSQEHTRSMPVFKEYQQVMLKMRNKLADPKYHYFTPPLVHGRQFEYGLGKVSHNDIIGKPLGVTVHTSNGHVVLADLPSMSEYILRRLPKHAVPIDPVDARLMVALLDIYLPSPGRFKRPPFEILEAGTGHGSLTLHLAQAVNHANHTIPHGSVEDFEFWRYNRNAVIHTVDANKKRSAAAANMINQFREGIYRGCVDFHTTTLQSFIASQAKERDTQELFEHVVLDLAFEQEDLAACTKALLPNGRLMIYSPNINLIEAAVLGCPKWSNRRLKLEKVLELGHGSSGGREWEIDFVPMRESNLEYDGPTRPFDPLKRTPDLAEAMDSSLGGSSLDQMKLNNDSSSSTTESEGASEEDTDESTEKRLEDGSVDVDEHSFDIDAFRGVSTQKGRVKWGIRTRPRTKSGNNSFVALFKKTLEPY